jgi:hypothetical protein
VRLGTREVERRVVSWELCLRAASCCVHSLLKVASFDDVKFYMNIRATVANTTNWANTSSH